jgi:hypothetical protein
MTFFLTCYHSTGAPLGPLKMWEKVLYNVVHKVKTGFGITKASYAFHQIHHYTDQAKARKGGGKILLDDDLRPD